MTERLHFHFSLSCTGAGNGNLLQCSCLENPRDGRAWWAAVYGVTQSQTRLKRLSSSSSRHFMWTESYNAWWPFVSGVFHLMFSRFTHVVTSIMFFCVQIIIILNIYIYAYIHMVVVVELLSCVQLLWPHGLKPARLLCPWDSPGKNIGVGCHFLLQEIFPTQESNLGLLHCRQIKMKANGIQNFPNQGSNLRPLQWNHGVLTTGPSGKSIYTYVTFFYPFISWWKIYFSKILTIHRT